LGEGPSGTQRPITSGAAALDERSRPARPAGGAWANEPTRVAQPIPPYVVTTRADRPAGAGTIDPSGAAQASLWQPATDGFRRLRFVGQLFGSATSPL